MNDYLAILVGLGITIIVQSSSVTTSALTPLVGIGVLPVAKMLPMTLHQHVRSLGRDEVWQSLWVKRDGANMFGEIPQTYGWVMSWKIP